MLVYKYISHKSDGIYCVFGVCSFDLLILFPFYDYESDYACNNNNLFITSIHIKKENKKMRKCIKV